MVLVVLEVVLVVLEVVLVVLEVVLVVLELVNRSEIFGVNWSEIIGVRSPLITRSSSRGSFKRSSSRGSDLERAPNMRGSQYWLTPQDLRELQTARFSTQCQLQTRLQGQIVQFFMLYLPMGVPDLENEQKQQKRKK